MQSKQEFAKKLLERHADQIPVLEALVDKAIDEADFIPSPSAGISVSVKDIPEVVVEHVANKLREELKWSVRYHDGLMILS